MLDCTGIYAGNLQQLFSSSQYSQCNDEAYDGCLSEAIQCIICQLTRVRDDPNEAGQVVAA